MLFSLVHADFWGLEFPTIKFEEISKVSNSILEGKEFEFRKKHRENQNFIEIRPKMFFLLNLLGVVTLWRMGYLE